MPVIVDCQPIGADQMDGRLDNGGILLINSDFLVCDVVMADKEIQGEGGQWKWPLVPQKMMRP